MGASGDVLQFLHQLKWQNLLIVLAILVSARLLVIIARWSVRRAAEKAPPGWRLAILRASPIVRILIDLAAIVAIVPILVEPTSRNVIALSIAVFLGLAFALKDYASSLVAGIMTVFERTYQPGDWIEVDGTYGEIKFIGLRCVYLVTPDDTEVIIPHLRIWTASVFNASGGNRSLLCVTDFYLHPEHDASAARAQLNAIAESSVYRRPETPVTVIVLEKPWGTHYRVKAYAMESREQFLLMSDITVRGKEALRQMSIRFAQAPYAVAGKDKGTL